MCKVFGITTDVNSVPKMLGVESENDYGFYQETAMGRYYARYLPDGSFDEEHLIRVMNPEQAAEAEARACAAIESSAKQVKQIIAKTPVIDMDKMQRNMAAIQRQTKERAEQMGRDIKRSLELAGFHPTYSHN